MEEKKDSMIVTVFYPTHNTLEPHEGSVEVQISKNTKVRQIITTLEQRAQGLLVDLRNQIQWNLLLCCCANNEIIESKLLRNSTAYEHILNARKNTNTMGWLELSGEIIGRKKKKK